MKLRDLDGRFIVHASPEGHRLAGRDSVDGAQGVMFQCPKCAEGKERGEEDGRRFVRGAHYIVIYFNNPKNAPIAPPEVDGNPRWGVSGSTLDDLTLHPSINLDVPGPNGEVSGCRWHGWVRDGDAE